MQKIIALLLIIIFFNENVLAQAGLPKLMPYRKGNLWGYCDSNKKIIIATQFDKPAFFEYYDYCTNCGHKKSIAVVSINNKEGLLSETGELLIPCKYDELIYSGNYEAPYVARQGDKFYKIDSKTAKLVETDFFLVPPPIEEKQEEIKEVETVADDFKPLIINHSNNLFTIIRETRDNQSKIKFDTLQLEAQNVKQFHRSTNLLFINRGNKWGLISFEKIILIPTLYDNIEEIWEENFFAVQLNEKWGLVEPYLSLSTPIIYQAVVKYKKGGFLIKKNDICGLLLDDLKTEILIDKICNHYYNISENYKLISVTTNEGELLGYVGFNGIKYWD
jgi:WG containing repeat